MLVRLCFGLLVVLGLGGIVTAYFGEENIIVRSAYAICGCGFLGMAFRLRKVIRRVKQIPTSATQATTTAMVVKAQAPQQQNKPVQVQNGERRPQDFRREQDNRPRCGCGARLRNGECPNQTCKFVPSSGYR